MREIVLATWEDAPKRVDNIKRSLETIYEIELEVDCQDVALDNVFPTEEFLENDKLALVLMKVIKEDYAVPIITVKRDEDYFVLDGHHRVYVFKKLLMKTAKTYVLKFPQNARYRAVQKRPLEDLPIKEVSAIEDPILKAWQRTLSILKHYEAIYSVRFYMKKEQVYLKGLVPTQPQVGKTQIDAIRELLVPIVCIQYKSKYYILDGHARALRAKLLSHDSIEALILIPAVQIDFGIVKTSQEMSLKRLEDVRVVEQSKT